MSVVVGIGGSGALAEDAIARAMVLLHVHPSWRVRSASALYANPAVGGKTSARFVNAAVVLDSTLTPQALMLALHAIETRVGRVRGEKNAARSLDLDILWDTALVQAPVAPVVPHPRVTERPFAFVPALEALARAGLPPPPALLAARRREPSAMLVRVG